MNNEQDKLKVLFKKQVIVFLDELISSFPQQTIFVIIRIYVKDQIPLDDVLGRYIKFCLPHKDVVANRNEEFIRSDTLMKSFGATEWAINTKKTLEEFWLSDLLDNDNKEMIWKWLNLLMNISNKYYSKFGNVNGWN